MPYFNCNDIPILKQHRIRAATNNEHNMLENLAEHSTKINILSKARRSTLIGLPPTLINTSKDLQQNIRVNPTVFFYNEETFQEASYRSIEDIREIKTNECLWIDVTG
ncbi:unnamed protein product, partial [Rotaria magnacalcarata]